MPNPKIVHTEVLRNINYDHPLNFLARKYVAKVVDDRGNVATGKGDTKAAAIANAIGNLPRG